MEREARASAFGAVAAHELHHDLSRAHELLEALRVDLPEGSTHQRDADSLGDLLERMQISVDALLVGDADRAERSPTRLGELVQRVARAHDPDERRIAVHVPSLVMNVDAVKLERIVDNLISNALAHTPEGAVVRVAAAFTAGRVTVTVVDDGPGIPPEVIRRLESPSPTSQVPSGLDVVARFARAHGGRVRVTGPGARVDVELSTSGAAEDPET